MLLAGMKTWNSVADESYLGRIVNTGIPTWSQALDGSWDDAQVWRLAIATLRTITDILWSSIVDYLGFVENCWLQGFPRAGQQCLQSEYEGCILSESEFLHDIQSNARVVYNMVAAQWDTGTCGGGGEQACMFPRARLTYYPVWWSSGKTYKNAITNELFVLTSAEGYIRNGDQTYLDNAQKVSTLFFCFIRITLRLLLSRHGLGVCRDLLLHGSADEYMLTVEGSGIRNSAGLLNDGLNDSTCTNNGQVYNTSCSSLCRLSDWFFIEDYMDL